MLMMMLLLASCSGCGGSDADATDARPIDAPGGGGGRGENCVPGPSSISCTGNQASVITYNVPLSPMWSCSRPPDVVSATCAAGCAVEGTMSWGNWMDPKPPPQKLCVEAPTADVGTPCGVCIPTRAVLAADGTVESMTYLQCQSGTCAATTAPVVAGYLQSCGAGVVSPYQSPGVNGLVGTGSPGQYCLIAWDSATSAVRSGVTRQCMGDWYCPEGSLCDDDMARLDTGPRLGVCKPGPRGTLTPAMLAP